ncbi:hypothetical protein [Curtobacterium sp. Curtsp57]|uniref:hypothetical protein n=1 Tax=Curtobacterium sp. Curtsp57 TaxID=3243047 RepID=UPI0039B4E5EA
MLSSRRLAVVAVVLAAIVTTAIAGPAFAAPSTDAAAPSAAATAPAATTASAAASSASGAQPPARSLPDGGRYTPLDTTRAWHGTVRAPGTSVELQTLAHLPADATAVVVNVEVEHPTQDGWIRVAPYESPAQGATQVFRAGQTVSGLTTVALRVNVGGMVDVTLSGGSATVYLDVAGSYGPTGSTYDPLPPARIAAPSVGTAPVRVPVAGRGGVPTDATAVALNVEVGSPTAAGYVRVTPAGRDAAVASQEFERGRTISNLVIVRLRDGAAQVKLSAGRATVYVDVVGAYRPGDDGSVFVPEDPVRVGTTTVGPTATPVQVTGIGDIPGAASAVAATVEVERTTAAGYVRVTTPGTDAQVATQVFSAGGAQSNTVMPAVTGTDTARSIDVRVSAGTARVDVDVVGYFLDGSVGIGFGESVSSLGCVGSTLPASAATRHAAFVVVSADHGPGEPNPCLGAALDVASTAVGALGQPAVQFSLQAGHWFTSSAPDPAHPWPTSDTIPGGPTVTGSPYGSCHAIVDQACSYVLGYWHAVIAARQPGITDPGAHRWWLKVDTDGGWVVPWLGSTRELGRNRAYLEGETAYLESIGASVGVIGHTPGTVAQLIGTVPPESDLAQLPTSTIWQNALDLAAARRACTTVPPILGGPVEMLSFQGYDRSALVSCR